MKLRIPRAARPAGGRDGHLAVIDQRRGREYDFWQVRSRPRRGGILKVSHGGRTRIGTRAADGLGSNATAAKFGLAAGVIRPEELAAGRINHALFMVVKCTNDSSVWPARGPGAGRSCSELGLSKANAAAMGQHFYLDMSNADIAALAAPRWKKAVLRAMARYGMFVGDTGAGDQGWTIVLQSGSSYTSFGLRNPWVALGRRYGVPSSVSSETGKRHYYFDLHETIDWRARLRVAHPCNSRRTC